MNEKPTRVARRPFGLTDFLWRWCAALVLVLATYNPTGHSYLHWVYAAFLESAVGPLHVLLGAVLVAGWVIFVVATSRSLGMLGTVVGVLVIGALIWLLADLGWVRTDTTSALVWLAELALATLLAVGLSWSHVWRRLSGQLEVDDG